MAKVAIIQPAYAHYRRELFQRLTADHDVLCIFVRGKFKLSSFRGENNPFNLKCLSGEHNKLWPFVLLRILLFIDADILISSIPTSIQSLLSYLVSQMRGKSFILWSEHWFEPYRDSSRPLLYKRLRMLQAQFILKRAKAIIVPGTKSYDYHKASGIPEKRIFIANQSTVDIAQLPGLEGSGSLMPNKKKLTILYLSRILRLKGLDVLLRAYKYIEAEFENIQLLIVGDGNFRQYCEVLARQLELRHAYFVGSLPHEQAIRYYNLADIFVLPSSGQDKSEPWGLVINEAVSMGLPIITTDKVGATDDLVKDGINGYITKGGDVEDLHTALAMILSDGELIKSMGRCSRGIFEDFNSYERMVEGFNGAINYAISYNL